MKAEAASALVESALAAGRKALSEHESKQLLSSYGIPVTRERPARGLEEAVSAAEDLGYPVVLKANSAGLLHKSEHGAVELCLGDAQAVRGAYRRLMHIKSYSVDEVLVQEMVPGNRELALGLIRDPQFGPCVMLGMGGVAAEILQDAVFRTAPISQAEAVEMARDLRHARILDAFRGQARTDLDVLTGSLVALSRLGVELDRVLEVDVNPMIITPEGRLVAADALVALAASPLVGPV